MRLKLMTMIFLLLFILTGLSCEHLCARTRGEGRDKKGKSPRILELERMDRGRGHMRVPEQNRSGGIVDKKEPIQYQTRHTRTPAAPTPSQGEQSRPAAQATPDSQGTRGSASQERPETVKGGNPGQPGSAPTSAPGASPSSITGEKEQQKKASLIKPGTYIVPIASVAAFAIVAVAVLIFLRKKPASLCARCGKPALKGMVYCDECNEQQEQANDAPQKAKVSAPQKASQKSAIATQTKEAPVKREEITPAKKVRPTGRVLAVITVRRGANQGFRFNFYESFSKISIGSAPECDMVVEEEEGVSGQHAVISISDTGGFSVHEMGSTTGLFVNNEKLKSANLKSGDVIRLGNTDLTFARL